MAIRNLKNLKLKKRKTDSWFILITFGAIMLVIGFAVIGFFYALLYSGIPRVRQVTISGAKNVPKEHIASLVISEIMRASKWKALLGSGNMLFWSMNDTTSMSDKEPRIESLQVTRNFKDRVVLIAAEERKMFAVWCAGANCYAISEDGTAFARVPRSEGYLFLKFRDENEKAVRMNQSVLDPLVWKTIKDATMAMVPAGFSPSEVIIGQDEIREWRVQTSRGPELKFSTEFTPPNFQQTLDTLVEEVDMSQIQELDFRVPEKIYYQ